MSSLTNPNAVNYLNKKDMLKYIHESKASYSWYIDNTNFKKTNFSDYDLIVCGQDLYDEARAKLMLQLINTKRRELLETRTSILRDSDLKLLAEEDYQYIDHKIVEFTGKLTDRIIQRAKLGKYNRTLYAQGKKRVTELPEDVDYPIEELVIRVYTYSHIPKQAEETGKEKKVSDYHERVNFPPYMHYGFYDNKFQVVAKSHHTKENVFSTTHGNVTHQLAEVYLLQSRRVSYKHNTKGYSYIDDMVSHANVQLVQVGLQFNELFSDNPFAYFTTIITNSFKTILKEEKRSQKYRDQMLMEAGFNPSITEQINQEHSRQEHWNEILGVDTIDPEVDYNGDWDNEAGGLRYRSTYNDTFEGDTTTTDDDIDVDSDINKSDFDDIYISDEEDELISDEESQVI